MLKKIFCFLIALLLFAELGAAAETVKNEQKMTCSEKATQSTSAEKKSDCTRSAKSTCSSRRTEADPADKVSQGDFGFPSEEANWRRGPSREWYVDFNKAIRKAQNEKKRLFVLVTGSDWCGACIKLKNTVLGSKEFKKAADDNFVLVYVDLPNRKTLPESQKSHNSMVTKKINASIYVPDVSIIDPFTLKTVGKISGAMPAETYVEKMLTFVPKTK